jgi:hypothetical protein
MTLIMSSNFMFSGDKYLRCAVGFTAKPRKRREEAGGTWTFYPVSQEVKGESA